MNLAKVRKNIANLEKIKDVISISKFDTLQELQKSTKVTNTFYEMATISRKLVEHVEKKYFISTALNKKSKKPVTIWIFATIDSKILSSSYSDQEAQILEGFNLEIDSIVAIGANAIEFAMENELNILFKEVDMDISITKLPFILSSLHNSHKMNTLKFVSNSSRNSDGPITVIPMSELNLKHRTTTGVDRKCRFDPSLSIAVDRLSSIYIQRVIEGLIRDAKFHYLKEKLLRHEEAIKNVDKKIIERTRGMRKLSRRIETEELTMIAQIAKRRSKNE